MSKAADIRAALAGGKALSLSALHEAIGYELTASPTAYVGKGELISERDGSGTVYYRLRAEGDPAPATRKSSQRPRRLKGFRAEAREKARKARKVKSYKQLRRTLQKPAAPALHDLARDNYLRVTKLLIDAVKQRCEGLDEDEVIGPLLTMHELASSMHQAAQS